MTVIAPTGIARRALLRGTAATALAAPFARSAAAAPDTLRAAISGYNVINTLDPAAAALIPEFYVIWALFNGLLKLDAHMQLAPNWPRATRSPRMAASSSSYAKASPSMTAAR